MSFGQTKLTGVGGTVCGIEIDSEGVFYAAWKKDSKCGVSRWVKTEEKWEGIGLWENEKINQLHLTINENNDLYVAFHANQNLDAVCKWDGEPITWRSLANSKGRVSHFYWHEGALYAIGFLNDEFFIDLYKYTSNKWEAVPPPAVGMNALDLFVNKKDTLYGLFPNLEDPSKFGLYQMERGSWFPLGTLTSDDFLQDLHFASDEDGNLYIAGDFKTVQPFGDGASAINAQGLAKWDGKVWHAIESVPNGTIESMACDELGNLFVGGTFTDDGSTSYLKKWDSAWQDWGTEINGKVMAISVAENLSVYAGGELHSGSGVSQSYFVAQFDPPNRGNIAMVLDVSGSMSGNKLHNLKQATNKLIHLLHKKDSFGIVTFSDNASYAWGTAENKVKTLSGTAKSEVSAKVNSLTAGGSTNISAGLNFAKNMLSNVTGGKTIILLSDGEYNEGGNPVTVADTIKSDETKIYTVALGAGSHHDTLEKIASSPENYHGAYSEHEIHMLFIDILSANNSLTVHANDVHQVAMGLPAASSMVYVKPTVQNFQLAVAHQEDARVEGAPNNDAKHELAVQLKDGKGQPIPEEQIEKHYGDNFVVLRHRPSHSQSTSFQGEARLKSSSSENQQNTIPISMSLTSVSSHFTLIVKQVERNVWADDNIIYEVKMVDDNTGQPLQLVDEIQAFMTSPDSTNEKKPVDDIQKDDEYTRRLTVPTTISGNYRVTVTATGQESGSDHRITLTKHTSPRVLNPYALEIQSSGPDISPDSRLEISVKMQNRRSGKYLRLESVEPKIFYIIPRLNDVKPEMQQETVQIPDNRIHVKSDEAWQLLPPTDNLGEYHLNLAVTGIDPDSNKPTTLSQDITAVAYKRFGLFIHPDGSSIQPNPLVLHISAKHFEEDTPLPIKQLEATITQLESDQIVEGVQIRTENEDQFTLVAELSDAGHYRADFTATVTAEDGTSINLNQPVLFLIE